MAQLSQEKARQAASGFSVGSTSFGRRNRMLKILARRDALRIRNDADREALSLENAAAARRAEAAQSRRAAKFSLLEGAFGIGDTLITGAALRKRQQARSELNG